MAIRYEVNASDLKAVMTSLPPVLRNEMSDALDYAANKYYKRFNPRLRGRPGIMSRSRGIALRFKKSAITGEGDKGLGIKIWARSKIAVRHEEGGEISGKNIAVPLSARGEYLMNSIYQGFGRIKARFRKGNPKDNIRPIKFGHQTYLAEVKRQKGADKVTPLFVLKNKVKYPARLGFYSTFDEMRGEIYEMLAKRVIRGIKKEWSRGEVTIRV